MSDSLRPHESQHTRPPRPSPTPGIYLNPCPSSWWCHPAISSSVVPFSYWPQSPQHQGLFHWVNSSHDVAKVLEFQLKVPFKLLYIFPSALKWLPIITTFWYPSPCLIATLWVWVGSSHLLLRNKMQQERWKVTPKIRFQKDHTSSPSLSAAAICVQSYVQVHVTRSSCLQPPTIKDPRWGAAGCSVWILDGILIRAHQL